MSFTDLINTAVARGERFEVDYEAASGTIIAVQNLNWNYGDMQYWGVIMSLGYQLLNGSPNIYGSQLLFAKSYTYTLTSLETGNTVQPALYCPENYKNEFLSFRMWLWEP